MWIKLWQFRLSLSVTRATAQLSRCNGKEPRELDKAEPEALSKPSCGRETQSPGVFPQPRLIRKGWRCLGKKLDWKSAPTRSFPYQEKRQGSLRPSEMARKRCGWLSVIPLLIVAERVVEGLQISRTNVGDTTPPPKDRDLDSGYMFSRRTVLLTAVSTGDPPRDAVFLRMIVAER